jgi:flagellar P-ring protein precursor FlgI
MVHLLRRLILTLALTATLAAAAQAQYLRDICRVKGQEENTLQGLGLVVGLKGSGDASSAPTSRALATLMQHMGQPLTMDPRSNTAMIEELKDARNVALVMVSATIPAAGARQGDQVNCTVSAVGAKSLEGGTLLTTALIGPRPGDQRVYAFAQGRLNVENPSLPTVGKIHAGCRVEHDFHNVFIKDGKFTLILDKNHAGFQMAQDIAYAINSNNSQAAIESSSDEADLAKALDQVNIEVRVPAHYLEAPVEFISEVLSQRYINPQSQARVVINQQTGSIVIGAEVAIGPVVITHQNMVIEAGGGDLPAQFVPVDPSERSDNAKLRDLVDALNGLNVPARDVIDIIKGLERNGKLYGQLIIE